MSLRNFAAFTSPRLSTKANSKRKSARRMEKSMPKPVEKVMMSNSSQVQDQDSAIDEAGKKREQHVHGPEHHFQAR